MLLFDNNDNRRIWESLNGELKTNAVGSVWCVTAFNINLQLYTNNNYKKLHFKTKCFGEIILIIYDIIIYNYLTVVYRGN